MLMRFYLFVLLAITVHAHRDGRWLFREVPIRELALEASDKTYKPAHLRICFRQFWVADEEGYYTKQKLQIPCGMQFHKEMDPYTKHDPWREEMDSKIQAILQRPFHRPHRPVLLYTRRRVREIYKSIGALVEDISRKTKHEIHAMDIWPGPHRFPRYRTRESMREEENQSNNAW